MKRLILAIAATLCAVSAAQTPGTGAYNHVTLDAPGFDQVNVGNLNTRFTIPIVSKAGRGLPFNYALQYEGLIWQPVNNGSTTTWVPNPNWGFNGQLNGNGVLGLMTYNYVAYVCASWYPPQQSQQQYIYGTHSSNYVYHDAFGAVHSFNYVYYSGCAAGPWGSGQAPTSYGSTTAPDGSGYQLVGNNVQTSNGVTLNPPTLVSGGSNTNTGLASDANGNQITFNGSGAFTDTTGTTELTISGSNPVQFTYPVTLQAGNATSATASLSYVSYTVQTNFGCSGVGEFGSHTEALVDHITLADNETYSFSYETTPGYSGSVTGRLASMKLPSGGVIRYSYQNGSNGVNCSDGSTEGLTRTTTDGTRSYTRPAPSQPSNTTLLTDERGKQSYFWFSVDTLGNYEITHRRAHDGTASNTNLLEEDITCYSGQTPSNGLCDGQSLALPITEADTTTTFNYVNTPATVKNSYDGSGKFLLRSSTYSGSTLLASTTNTFLTPNRVTELTSTKTTDGSGNAVAYTGYGYDETSPTATTNLPQHTSPSSYPGNQTSVHVSIDGTTTNTLNTTTAYFDTGMPASTKDPGGSQTTYGYDSTGAFQTSTTLPTPSSGVGLSTSASYDAASGAPLSVTGLNQGQTFSATQYDAVLRPTAATTPEGGKSTTAYTTNQISAKTQQNSSQWTDQETYLDSYGRTVRVAVQSSSGWYVTDSCYTNGVLQWQSTPYLSSSSNPSSTNCSASKATQYTLDGLGRTTQVATPDGHTTTTSFNGRAAQIADSNGQTRILQKDVLGRLTGVCETTSSPQTWDGGDSTVNCGFDIGGNGFLTAYTYSLASHTTTVKQGVQTRVFQTDAAGRSTSVQEPESGTTIYSYGYGNSGLLNTYGLQIARVRGRANQNGGATTTTTSQYDTLGRLTDVTYNDGTPAKNFAYDAPNHSNQGAIKGQLVGLSTLSNGNAINARGIFYDIMGRVSATDDCITGWCGQPYDAYRWYGYDLASEETYEAYSTQPNQAGVYSVAYSYNTAGQLTSFINGQNNAANAPTIYSATASSMQPGGPQFITYGNNTTAYRVYDPMNRFSGQWVCGLPGGYNCPNSHYFYGFGLAMSGSKLAAETDTVNGDWSQYSYDPVGNLSFATNWQGNASNGFTAGYDRYGNRWNESVSHTASGTGPNQVLSFYTTNNQIQGYTYDAAGNLINDTQHTYQYDAENNLLTIDNGSTATYWYDALNQRDAVANSAGVFRFGFDVQGRRATQWNNGTAIVNQTQYYANGQPVAFWTAADGNIHFEHGDWLGTERFRTDLNGNPSTVATFSSLPFGEPNLTSGSDLDGAHFTGMDEDGAFSASSLGLHHAMFREYNSTLGRWMSPDPYSGSYDLSNPQSLNRYSYVLNNPLSGTDPSGLDYCQGDNAAEQTTNYDDCTQANGTWIYTTTVNVTADPYPQPGVDDPGFDGLLSSDSTSSQYNFSAFAGAGAPNNGTPQMVLVGQQSGRSNGYCNAVNSRMIMNSCLYSCETSGGNAATALFPRSVIRNVCFPGAADSYQRYSCPARVTANFPPPDTIGPVTLLSCTQ